MGTQANQDSLLPVSPEHQRLQQQIEKLEEENEALRFALGLQQQSPSHSSTLVAPNCPTAEKSMDEMLASSIQFRRERNAACAEVDRLTVALARADTSNTELLTRSSAIDELQAENAELRQREAVMVDKAFDDEASIRALQDQVIPRPHLLLPGVIPRPQLLLLGVIPRPHLLLLGVIPRPHLLLPGV